MAKKNKKDEKKKKKKGPPWLLIILILLLFLIGGIGFGMGWFEGDGDGEGNADVSSVADSAADDSKADDSSAAEKTTVAVKISGDKYVYDGAELTLEDLKSKLQSLDKAETIIEVTDENAVANAVTALKEMLDSLGLPFTGIS